MVLKKGHSVYFSRHLFRDNGREQIELSFLADLELENNHLDVEVDMATNVEAFEMDIFKDFILSGKESDYFESLIKNWKVSATAVTDFLNIIDNQYIDFVHRHILKIPSQTNKYLLFGSLVHGVIEDLYMEKVDFANYEEEVVLKYLDLRMTKLPILKSEKEDMRKKALLLFPRIFKYLLSKNFVEPGVEVFMNCKLPFNQDFIPLIGAIDVLNIVHKKNLLEIYDFKTGKAINDLYVDKGDQSKKLKAFRYKIQLHFYILLVNLYFGQSYAAFQKQASLIFIESAKLENMQVNLEFDLEFYEKLKVVIQNIYYIVKNNDPMDTSKYSKDFQGILDYFEDLSVVKHRL